MNKGTELNNIVHPFRRNSVAVQQPEIITGRKMNGCQSDFFNSS
jgi:hypothetical protein